MHHLVGFGSVYLEAGAGNRIVIYCSLRPIQRCAGASFTLVANDLTIRAASYAGDPAAVDATLAIPE